MLLIGSPQASNPAALHVRLVSGDMELDNALRAGLGVEKAPDAIVAHALGAEPVREPDIVLVDAGPPLPDETTLDELRSQAPPPLTLVLASEMDAEARELGEELQAVGYIKKGAGVEDVAALVLELASIAQIER